MQLPESTAFDDLPDSSTTELTLLRITESPKIFAARKIADGAKLILTFGLILAGYCIHLMKRKYTMTYVGHLAALFGVLVLIYPLYALISCWIYTIKHRTRPVSFALGDDHVTLYQGADCVWSLPLSTIDFVTLIGKNMVIRQGRQAVYLPIKLYNQEDVHQVCEKLRREIGVDTLAIKRRPPAG